MVRSRLTVLPTSWLMVGRWLREPGGRPGPGRLGFGALAGRVVVARMFRKARRTRGRGQPARPSGSLPGPAQVLGQWAGEPQLGMGGEDQPGPAVRRVRGADLRRGPA